VSLYMKAESEEEMGWLEAESGEMLERCDCCFWRWKGPWAKWVGSL
jgi:hypothetical protein